MEPYSFMEYTIQYDGGAIMKKNSVAKKCIALCLALSMVMIPTNRITAHAVEVIATVSGSVQKGTTSDLLILSTKEGRMEIKIDSSTDTSGCKLLLPGQKISVSVSHGSDEYLHAVKISNEGQAATVSVDTSKTSVVTGTINEKSKGDVLYFDTQYGEMQIKLDDSTNMSGCKVLVTGKTYSITCARGDDAYMHAISISDSAVPSSTSSSSNSATSNWTPSPDGTVDVSTTWVSGKVTKNTKDDILFLSTNDGVMEIALDSKTDSTNGMMAMVGKTMSVSVYRGSDAYMHAACIVGSKSNTIPTNVNTSSVSTVTGTVLSKSTENILYLNTQYGEMVLKTDYLRSAKGFKILVEGKKVSVNCARGDDAYMHVLDITAM